MITQLEREAAKLKHGDHVCPIFENLGQQMATALPFIKRGIENGERVTYGSDDAGLKRMSVALTEAGVDVDRECKRGALSLVIKRDAYLRAGKPDPHAMIGYLHEAEMAALAGGFSGARFIGDMSWVLGTDFKGEQLIEYESLLNAYLAQSRCVSLCQYDRARFDPALIHDVLRVHPIAILGDFVCQNPYYEPPELVIGRQQMAGDEHKRKRVDWWIRRLKETAKRDQEAQRAQERIEEQAALLDQARDAVSVRDLEGKILFWSKGAERIYGWTLEEVIGQRIGERLFVDCQKFEEANRLLLHQGEWCGEVKQRTKDSRELTVEARWALVRDKNGQPKSVLAINTDITERKKLETRLIRSQRMESIGALAGGVAHDLNNILTPILMSIAVLQFKVTDPKARRILETIEVSSKRGADIVRQVLSFAQGLEGARTEVQPKRLFQDIKTIIEDTFPRNIRLELPAVRDSWAIWGDATQLLQVLLNLCVNARDAMPDGGNLVIAAENLAVDPQYASMHAHAKPGRYVAISVTDSGTGIAPEIIDKIFEPFFTTKEAEKGTGLGLSTVMAIVKAHDGFIDVVSEPGRGTTFKVCLPVAGALPENRKDIVPEAAPRGKGETILLVDDEASILAITSQTLEAFGYQTLIAHDGVEAVTICARRREDIAAVLTDISMPVMDGGTTIRVLKKMNPAIKVIAVSGTNADGSRARETESIVKAFISKPYTAETLLTALRKVLDED